MVVVAGIDVSKAIWAVAMAEGPVYRFANRGPSLPLAAAQGPCGGHTGGM